MKSNTQISEFAFEASLRPHVLPSASTNRDRVSNSALMLMRSVDAFLAAEENRAIDVSEISRMLHVSRRTLHRAFRDTIGIGPIAYVRYRRLCAIHDILCSSGRHDRTIEELAFQFGFLNTGRFAQYYRSQFGQFPAETRARAP